MDTLSIQQPELTNGLELLFPVADIVDGEENAIAFSYYPFIPGFTSGFTFARASKSWGQSSDGSIVEYAVNAPAYGYKRSQRRIENLFNLTTDTTSEGAGWSYASAMDTPSGYEGFDLTFVSSTGDSIRWDPPKLSGVDVSGRRYAVVVWVKGITDYENKMIRITIDKVSGTGIWNSYDDAYVTGEWRPVIIKLNAAPAGAGAAVGVKCTIQNTTGLEAGRIKLGDVMLLDITNDPDAVLVPEEYVNPDVTYNGEAAGIKYYTTDFNMPKRLLMFGDSGMASHGSNFEAFRFHTGITDFDNDAAGGAALSVIATAVSDNKHKLQKCIVVVWDLFSTYNNDSEVATGKDSAETIINLCKEYGVPYYYISQCPDYNSDYWIGTDKHNRMLEVSAFAESLCDSNRFLNILDIAIAWGLTSSDPNDVTDANNGIVPRSLRNASNDVHWNNWGYSFLETALYALMVANGDDPGTTGQSFPYSQHMLNAFDIINYFDDSLSPANQTTPALPTGTFTVQVHGKGSALIADNTAVGGDYAPAWEGMPHTFTLSTGGTLDVTITGTPDHVQIVNEDHPCNIVVAGSGGAPFTRLKDDLELAAGTIGVTTDITFALRLLFGKGDGVGNPSNMAVMYLDTPSAFKVQMNNGGSIWQMYRNGVNVGQVNMTSLGHQPYGEIIVVGRLSTAGNRLWINGFGSAENTSNIAAITEAATEKVNFGGFNYTNCQLVLKDAIFFQGVLSDFHCERLSRFGL